MSNVARLPHPAIQPELDQGQKARLLLASRIAAGMAANPGIYEGPDWKTTIALDSWTVAGKLLSLARNGGL